MLSPPDAAVDTAGAATGARVVAFCIDALPVGALAVLAWTVEVAATAALADRSSLLAPGAGDESVLVVIAVVSWGLLVGGAVAYRAGLHAVAGQTAGKRLVDLVVADADGGPCTPRAAAVRTTVLLAPAPLVALLELLGGFGGAAVGAALAAGWVAVEFAVALVDDRGRRLGDRAAGTVVAREAVAARRS